MRRIVFVVANLGGGGLERVLLQILRLLDRGAFRPVLVLFSREGPYLRNVPDDVKRRDLQKRSRNDAFRLILRLRAVFRKEKPDIVVSFGQYENFLVCLARMLGPHGFPLCLGAHTHTTLATGELSYGWFRSFLVRVLYPTADRIVAVSEGVRNDLLKVYRIPGRKVTIIHNPFDIEAIKAASGEEVDHPWFQGEKPVLLSVGRLVRQKDYFCVLRVFQRIRQVHDARLVILGTGPDREALQKEALRLGIAEHTAFPGFQANPFKYMKRATVFMLSSLYEGFANVLVEAMACGTPVVSTRCPSGPEELITDGVNGLLVPVGDENAFSDAVLRLLADPSLRERLSIAGMRRARDFEARGIVSRYESLFREVSRCEGE